MLTTPESGTSMSGKSGAPSSRSLLKSLGVHLLAILLLMLIPAQAMRSNAAPTELEVVFHRARQPIEVPVRASLPPGPRKETAVGPRRDGGGKPGFLATGRAYVLFALANPALFRLVFSSPPEHDVLSSAPGSVPEAFRMLLENAVSQLPPYAAPEAVAHSALDSWARVHGLAMLMLDGQIPANAALIDAVLGTPERS